MLDETLTIFLRLFDIFLCGVILCFSVLDAQASVAISTDIDKRYYDHLIGSVPPESHSVPLILHCLLEQVSACSIIPFITDCDIQDSLHTCIVVTIFTTIILQSTLDMD